jgi:hypothetical protein
VTRGDSEILNNRELAALILVTAGLVACIGARPIRSSLAGVVRALLAPKLLSVILAMIGYIVLLLWLGYEIGIWNSALASETAAWFVGSALVLLFNAADASKQSGFFRRVVTQTLGITVVVDFVLNDLFVLNLPAELVLQVVVTFLVLLSLVASRSSESRQVKTMADVLLLLIGLAVIGFIAVQTIKHWDQVATGENALELILPIWLTAGLAPFIYVVSVYVSYGSAFARIDWALDDLPNSRRRVKLALLSVLRGRRVDVSSFAGHWIREAAAATSFRATRAVIKSYRDSQKKTGA